MTYRAYALILYQLLWYPNQYPNSLVIMQNMTKYYNITILQAVVSEQSKEFV